MNDLAGLKQALAFSVSAIAAEHMFSAGMSSPWSVAKFATSEEDREQVWRLFRYSVIASTAFALMVGILMQDLKSTILAVIGVGGVSIFMYYEYQQALTGQL